jgi:hypothetical protein
VLVGFRYASLMPDLRNFRWTIPSVDINQLPLGEAFASRLYRQCSSAVEQRTHKPLVGGSNPPPATNFFSDLKDTVSGLRFANFKASRRSLGELVDRRSAYFRGGRLQISMKIHLYL